MADPKTDTAPQDSEGWRPEPGDSITGEVIEVAKGWSDYTNSHYPIVTVKQEDGVSKSIHCFHEILKQRMMDVRPTVGKEITVTCEGKKQTRDGKREYMSYKVIVPGDTGAQVWDDLGAQPARAAAAAGQGTQMTTEDDIPF